MDSEMPAKTTIAVTEETSLLLGRLAVSVGESKLSLLSNLGRLADSMDFNQFQTLMQAFSTVGEYDKTVQYPVKVNIFIELTLYCRPTIVPLVVETLREEFCVRISST